MCVCVYTCVYVYVCVRIHTDNLVCIIHGRCFAQCLTCNKHSVNTRSFYSEEEEDVLMTVGKEDGRIRWQKVDLTVFLLCRPGDATTHGLLTAEALTRPQQGF